MLLISGCGGGGGGGGTGSYTVGGTVAGLAPGNQITIQNNGGDALTISADGTFTFATPIAGDAAYTVTVKSHTPGEGCALSNASGRVSATNVTNVVVICAAGAESVVYSFGGTDGRAPSAGLIVDVAGNLYGTTYYGGANDTGTVYKITPTGAEIVLHSFAPPGSADGMNPYAGLTMDGAGNLYGTTWIGGVNDTGAVFKIASSGNESILYSFGAAATGDGSEPASGLIMDSAGNLYGTTYLGGAIGNGTVFRITPAGNETILHSFGQFGSGDGINPYASVVLDSAGDLYGTTFMGGANGTGAIFKIAPSGDESIFYSFGPSSSSDGNNPYAGLTIDSAGNFYGTTNNGGTNNTGALFKIVPSGAESVVHSFGTGSDGQRLHGALIMDSAGNLYGTTYGGGSNGTGTVFKITPSGTYSVLYSFGPSSGSDGNNPYPGLTIDSVGNLYGTTYNGGANHDGAVFKID